MARPVGHHVTPIPFRVHRPALLVFVAMSLLVLRAMTHGVQWVFASILLHTALNAGALLLLPYGYWQPELWVAACALGSVGIIVWLARSAPGDDDAKPSQEPIEPIAIQRRSIEASADALEDR